jgi:ATP-dependent Clp protease ATP-binding subunit ClpX
MQVQPVPSQSDRRPPTGARRCSFCGKREQQVEQLITSKNSVRICNECVALCNEILATRRPEDTSS